MSNDHHRIRTDEAYRAACAKAAADPEGFWAAQAERFTWKRKWYKVLEWDFTRPDVKWFIGGRLNITENCLDRHLDERGNKIALIWEPNDPKEVTVPVNYR